MIVEVGSVSIGDGDLSLLAGPCVIEGRDHALRHAETITAIARRHGMGVIYKSSYDKANRTSIRGERGPGIEAGLKILAEVSREFDVPVVTDIHESHQAQAAAEAVDLLQIPAFLCRQTDLLLAAAATGRAVNVKKGQFLAPDDMRHVIDKLSGAGCDRVLVTERGTSFGYHDLVVDFRSLPALAALDRPVVFDATHSVQRPGAGDGKSGGDRTLVPGLAAAAVANGVDALFLEVHEDPDRAPSDGPNMVPLAELDGLLTRLIRIHHAAR